MSKYYKAEEVQTLINSLKCYGIPELNLDGLPTIEVSEDCISREYMLRALNGYGKDWQEDCEIAEIIRNAPSVIPRLDKEDLPSVVPKDHSGESTEMVGEWIDKGDYAECSNCGANSGTQFNGVEPVPLKTKFCPNCGAKMKV